MADMPQASNPAGQKLRVFIENYPPGLTAFGQLIKVSRQTVYNYITGKRIPTLEKAYLIEEATKGRVTMKGWAEARIGRKQPTKKLGGIL